MQVTQAVRRAVQCFAKGTAIVGKDGTTSWEGFAARVARLAGGLQGLGVKPGDRVAILALNSHRYLEFFFGVAWAGAVFVPINNRLSVPEMVFWLQDSGATLLFIDDSFLPILAELQPQVPGVRGYVHVGDGPAPAGLTAYEALIDGAAAVDDVSGRGDDLAGIFYTGGTTGRSKGVMLSHANFIFNALNCQPVFQFDAATVWLHAGPMFHLADGAATFGVTMAGGAHAFIPRFEPVAFLDAVQRDRATHTLCVPTMVNMLVNHPDLASYDIKSLKSILYGASPMPEAVIRRAMDAMPGVGFTQAYGQSEASPVMTLLPPEYHVLEGATAGKLRSAGRPAFGVEARIVDEDDNEVPRGTVGEIAGRGPNVMLGYWNLPEVTAHTLRNGWLHTGDGGYMDEDGFIYVVDRMKDMIISGGENVYSAEVESALYKHEAVQECAVIGVPDEKWGERVHAIIRLKPGASATEEAIKAHCHALIAGYKCPRSLEFRDEPLPISGAGKILKTDLRKPYWEGKGRQVN